MAAMITTVMAKLAILSKLIFYSRKDNLFFLKAINNIFYGVPAPLLCHSGRNPTAIEFRRNGVGVNSFLPKFVD